MKQKLSTPQRLLLEELKGTKGRYVSNYYGPAKVLVKLGLCKWVKDRLVITDLGSEMVKEKK